MSSIRHPHVVAAMLAATSLSACASVDADSPNRRRESTGFVVASSGWLSGATASTERTDDPGRSPSTPTSPALQPDGPWLGTIGVRSLLPGKYEYGLGICLPTSTLALSNVEQHISSDPLRAVAIGVWLKFDF